MLSWPVEISTACLTGFKLSMASCCRILETDSPDCSITVCAPGCAIFRNKIDLSRAKYRSPLGLLLWAPTAVCFLLRHWQCQRGWSGSSLDLSQTPNCIVFIPDPPYYLPLPASSGSCWGYHIHHFAKWPSSSPLLLASFHLVWLPKYFHSTGSLCTQYHNIQLLQSSRCVWTQTILSFSSS